jgi:hypothetical protein
MACSKSPYGVEQGIFLSRTRKLELPNRELSRPTGPTGVEFYLVFGVELWSGLRFTEFELVRSLPFARRWAFRGKPLGSGALRQTNVQANWSSAWCGGGSPSTAERNAGFEIVLEAGDRGLGGVGCVQEDAVAIARDGA